jgi:phosphonate transport system substrate-binding protein
MNLILTGLLTLLSALGNPPAQQGDPKPVDLRFGVYQSEKATVMYRKLTPVLEALQEGSEKTLGRSVDIELKIFRTYDEAIDSLVAGQIDFVRFGPAPYVLAKRRQAGLDLLAMELEGGEKRFQGVICVRKHSPIQTLADLKGKRFAFGDPNSTIGRYLVQAQLVDAGLHASDLASFKYLPRHDAVAQAVDIGDFDAGSLRMAVFQRANEKDTMRVLLTFENVTSPWVARAGLDPVVAAALRDSLLSLKDPAVLKELKVSGFAPTSDDEYQLVRDGMKRADEFENAPRRL